jgi:hypothetical protein
LYSTNFIAGYMSRGLWKAIGQIKKHRERISEQPIIMTHFQMVEISTSQPKPDNTQDWIVHNGESNPCTGLDRSGGFQQVVAPKFKETLHMKVVRLSALHALSHRKHSVRGCVYPRAIVCQ